MNKSKANQKQNPPRELIAEATEVWKRRAEAEFCISLETARSLWRRYRALVEGPGYPPYLAEAMLAESERLPDDSIEIGGEEIFSPGFKQECFTRGLETARAWEGGSRLTQEIPQPKNDPGIRVYGLDEEPDFISLTKRQTEQIRLLAGWASEEGEPKPRTDEERNASQARMAAYTKSAADLESLLERLRKLDEREMESVLALIELLEFGDGGLEHGSWLLSIVQELLRHVAWRGPGPANELPFGPTLLAQTVAFDYFEDWISDARRLTERYPTLVGRAVNAAAKAAG